MSAYDTQGRAVANNEIKDKSEWIRKALLSAAAGNMPTKCGFEVQFSPKIGFSDLKAPIPLGLGVFVKSGQQNDIGNAILSALHSIGHAPSVAEESLDAPANVILIRVWHKPDK